MPLDTGLTPGLQLLLDDADRIEALDPARFDMREGGSPDDAIVGECGTPACIGGWVRAWARERRCGIVETGVARWDVSTDQAYALMFPRTGWAAPIRPATPTQAAQAMRNVALRGDPHWEEIE